jgi:hypothetical protein
VQHVLVDRPALRLVGLDREHREPLLRHQVLEEPVLQLEELARPVRRLAERRDPRPADQLADRRQVVEPLAGLGRAQREAVLADVRDDLGGRRPGRGERQRDLDALALALERAGAREGALEHRDVPLVAARQDRPERAVGLDGHREQIRVVLALRRDLEVDLRWWPRRDLAGHRDAAVLAEREAQLARVGVVRAHVQERADAGAGAVRRQPPLAGASLEAEPPARVGPHVLRDVLRGGDQRDVRARDRRARGVGDRAAEDDRHRGLRLAELEAQIVEPGGAAAVHHRAHDQHLAAGRHVELDARLRPRLRAGEPAIAHVVERPVGAVDADPQRRALDGVGLDPAAELDVLAREGPGGQLRGRDAGALPAGRRPQAQRPRAAVLLVGDGRQLALEPDPGLRLVGVELLEAEVQLRERIGRGRGYGGRRRRRARSRSGRGLRRGRGRSRLRRRRRASAGAPAGGEHEHGGPESTSTHGPS